MTPGDEFAGMSEDEVRAVAWDKAEPGDRKKRAIERLVRMAEARRSITPPEPWTVQRLARITDSDMAYVEPRLVAAAVAKLDEIEAYCFRVLGKALDSVWGDPKHPGAHRAKRLMAYLTAYATRAQQSGRAFARKYKRGDQRRADADRLVLLTAAHQPVDAPHDAIDALIASAFAYEAEIIKARQEALWRKRNPLFAGVRELPPARRRGKLLQRAPRDD